MLTKVGANELFGSNCLVLAEGRRAMQEKLADALIVSLVKKHPSLMRV